MLPIATCTLLHVSGYLQSASSSLLTNERLANQNTPTWSCVLWLLLLGSLCLRVEMSDVLPQLSATYYTPSCPGLWLVGVPHPSRALLLYGRVSVQGELQTQRLRQNLMLIRDQHLWKWGEETDCAEGTTELWRRSEVRRSLGQPSDELEEMWPISVGLWRYSDLDLNPSWAAHQLHDLGQVKLWRLSFLSCGVMVKI